MHRSACRPTSSASASRAPVVEQHDVHVLRPVARRDTGPHRRVRVHPLARRRARQQLQEHLEVGERGHDLLDAHHRDQRLRQGQAHPAVALGLEHHQRAGLGDGEVRAGDRDLRRQELPPQVHAGRPRPARAARRSGPRGAPGISRRKISRISARLRWIAGTRMCEGRSCRAGRSARPDPSRTAVIPASASASLSSISWVAIDLTLTTSSRAGGPHQVGDDPAGLGRVAGPVHLRRRPRSPCLELARASRAGGRITSVLDRAARPARSCSQSGSSATTAARLARIVPVARAQVAPQLVVAQRAARPPPGTAGMPEPQSPGAAGAALLACSPGSRRRASPGRPTAAARQHAADVHQARVVRRREHLGAGRPERARTLSAPSRPTRRRSSARTCRRTRSTPPPRQLHQFQAAHRAQQPPACRRAGACAAQWQVGW